MTGHLVSLTVMPVALGIYLPFCTAEIRQTMLPIDGPPAILWEQPTDLEKRDLLNGPWGARRAPDASARYTLVQLKHSGVNPGMTVRDPQGRQWSVKQAPADEQPDESPIEVVVSRILSAIGYRQPPVYYLPAFTLEDDWGVRTEPGGRFRLKEKTLKDRGEWSWQQNPFVGTKPYQGLLVVLMMLNSSDLKNSNNTLYEHRSERGLQYWYVVRDVGTALGSTGRLVPQKGDPETFARLPFVTGIREGFVEFDYRGWHQELVRGRITAEDVAWASDLLAGLSDRQWHDAFRAGGYTPERATPFIRTLQRKIAEGRRMAGDVAAAP